MPKKTMPCVKDARNQELGREKWLTVAQMQEYMNAGRSKAYELVSSGEVKSYRLGRKILVDRESLDRYIRANGSPGAPRD